VDVTAWGAASGIPAGQILDLGSVPNAFMPPILREMDVALFPNRSEGGTNLVAMECMACGVPVILSKNTGHLDLVDGDNAFWLERQMAVSDHGAGVGGTPGWGESDVEEIVAALETAFTKREDAKRRGLAGAETMKRFTWANTAAAMKDIVLAL
jgi:glycosyltransferase involved in cell wall biosynthesis